MDRRQYNSAFRKLKRSKEFIRVKLPPEVYEFGWEVAKLSAYSWMVERVEFWIYAYDRTHKWTNQDFLYDINENTYRKAKKKRAERRAAKKIEDATRKLEPAKELVNIPTWEECGGSLKRTLKKLGVKTLEEAVFNTNDNDSHYQEE